MNIKFCIFLPHEVFKIWYASNTHNTSQLTRATFGVATVSDCEFPGSGYYVLLRGLYSLVPGRESRTHTCRSHAHTPSSHQALELTQGPSLCLEFHRTPTKRTPPAQCPLLCDIVSNSHSRRPLLPCPLWPPHHPYLCDTVLPWVVVLLPLTNGNLGVSVVST